MLKFESVAFIYSLKFAPTPILSVVCGRGTAPAAQPPHHTMGQAEGREDEDEEVDEEIEVEGAH